MINGQEVTRALVCATELAINHSTTKMDLKTRPIMSVAKDFQVRSYWNIIDIQLVRIFTQFKKNNNQLSLPLMICFVCLFYVFCKLFEFNCEIFTSVLVDMYSGIHM